MTNRAEQNKPCPVCGYENRPGLLMCENCGSLLNLRAETRRATRDLRDVYRRLGDLQPEAVEDEVVGRIRGTEYESGMAVRLSVDEAARPILVKAASLANQATIGRRDPNTDQVPDIDLDQFAGYRMGVSRKHALLQISGGALTVMDLGSSNGTYLNGNRLAARQPEVVLGGDMLRVGQVLMTVTFIRQD